jgi:subtilisin family serine protease
VLLAPGTDILTLVPQNGYDFVSGSSMAAANVSGGIALLLSHRLKVNEIREVLAQTSRGDSINICVALAGKQGGQQCDPTSSRAIQNAGAVVLDP